MRWGYKNKILFQALFGKFFPLFGVPILGGNPFSLKGGAHKPREGGPTTHGEGGRGPPKKIHGG